MNDIALEPSAERLQPNKKRWYALAVLTAAQACHYLDRTIIALVIEPVRTEFGLSDSQIGFLSGLAYGIAFALFAIPLGWLVDRRNRRNVLATILLLWSGLTAACGLAQSYATLLFARMAVGAAEAGGSPTGMSMLSDYFPARERSSAMSIWYTSAAIGVTVTFLGGGWVAEAFGWRAAFLFAGLPGIVVAIVLLTTVQEPARGATEERAWSGPALTPAEAAAYVWKRRAVLHAMMGIIIAGLTISAYSIWTVAFLTRYHGFDLTGAGFVAAIAMGLCGAGGVVLFGFIADRLNRRGYQPRRVALLCAVTTASAVALGTGAVLTAWTPLAIGLLFLYATMNTAHNGPANALVVSLVGPQVRGFSVAALQVGTNLVGFGLGPFVVGILSDWFGGEQSLRLALATTLLLNLWAMLHFLLASRHAERDFQRMETKG